MAGLPRGGGPRLRKYLPSGPERWRASPGRVIEEAPYQTVMRPGGRSPPKGIHMATPSVKPFEMAEPPKDSKKPDTQELLKKADKPNQESRKLHPFYQGKIEIATKVPVRSFADFAIWYTPGVAEPCKQIAKDKELASKLTNKWE